MIHIKYYALGYHEEFIVGEHNHWVKTIFTEANIISNTYQSALGVFWFVYFKLELLTATEWAEKSTLV